MITFALIFLFFKKRNKKNEKSMIGDCASFKALLLIKSFCKCSFSLQKPGLIFTGRFGENETTFEALLKALFFLNCEA